MIIEIEKLDEYVKQADKIFVEPEGEEILLQLLIMKDQIERALKEAKEKIEQKALALDPNFASIQGDKIKVSYRYYGTRFFVDETLAEQIPAEFCEIETKRKVKTEVVKDFLDANGTLPVGIVEADRTKQISITPKGEEKEGSET